MQNANTKRSAIDKFSRNMVVEVRKTEDVKMTIMGDHVNVRLRYHVHKGNSRFSSPRVITQISGNCVVLDDGKKWNVSKLVKTSVPVYEQSDPESEDAEPPTCALPVRRSTRPTSNQDKL